MDIFVQAIGIVAMSFNILSYQKKNAKGIMVIQLMGGLLFGIHFFLLGAYIAAILNIMSMARGLVFVLCKKPPKAAMYFFILFSVTMYVLNFTSFGKEATFGNLVLNLLPVISAVVLTVAYFNGDGNLIRKCGYISSPCWLIYNIFEFSIGGIVCEAITLISITVGLLRFRKNKKQER